MRMQQWQAVENRAAAEAGQVRCFLPRFFQGTSSPLADISKAKTNCPKFECIFPPSYSLPIFHWAAP